MLSSSSSELVWFYGNYINYIKSNGWTIYKPQWCKLQTANTHRASQSFFCCYFIHFIHLFIYLYLLIFVMFASILSLAIVYVILIEFKFQRVRLSFVFFIHSFFSSDKFPISRDVFGCACFGMCSIRDTNIYTYIFHFHKGEEKKTHIYIYKPQR